MQTREQGGEDNFPGTPASSGISPRATYAWKDARSVDPSFFMESGAMFATAGV